MNKHEENQTLMDLIHERAQTLAELYKKMTVTDSIEREYILSDIISEELDREGLSFEENIIVVRKALEIIEKQKPRTKQERLLSVLARKNFYTTRVINLISGKVEIAWKKSELESYCRAEGIELQEFIDWNIENNTEK